MKNKQAIIKFIIAKAAVTKSVFKSTTMVVGEDTNLLLLLLYYAEATNCTELILAQTM